MPDLNVRNDQLSRCGKVQFRLEQPDGEPAEPPTLVTVVPSWSTGDRVFVNPTLRYVVVDKREGVLVFANASDFGRFRKIGRKPGSVRVGRNACGSLSPRASAA